MKKRTTVSMAIVACIIVLAMLSYAVSGLFPIGDDNKTDT
jgi:hypothetical protein